MFEPLIITGAVFLVSLSGFILCTTITTFQSKMVEIESKQLQLNKLKYGCSTKNDCSGDVNV